MIEEVDELLFAALTPLIGQPFVPVELEEAIVRALIERFPEHEEAARRAARDGVARIQAEIAARGITDRIFNGLMESQCFTKFLIAIREKGDGEG